MKERDLPRAIVLQQEIAACDQRLQYLDSVRFDLIVPGAVPAEVSVTGHGPATQMMDAQLSGLLGMDEGVIFGVAREAIRNRINSDKAALRSELERMGVELEARAA